MITFPPGSQGSDGINIYKASLRWGGVGENLQLLHRYSAGQTANTVNRAVPSCSGHLSPGKISKLGNYPDIQCK